jgi:hypothetical protein
MAFTRDSLRSDEFQDEMRKHVERTISSGTFLPTHVNSRCSLDDQNVFVPDPLNAEVVYEDILDADEITGFYQFAPPKYDEVRFTTKWISTQDI